VLAATLGVAACGSETNTATIGFDEPPPTDATTSLASVEDAMRSRASTSLAATTVQATAAAWVDVTANLVGLDSECGNLHFLTARPDRDMLIAGVASQGLWASEDGASEWTPLGRVGGSAFVNNRATSIVFDPADPRRFWESGIYGAAIFQTRDNGASFEALGHVPHSDLVSVDFTDPRRQVLVSGTHEAPRVYRSRDGGRSWEDISAGLPPNIGSASLPHVVDSSTYLLGTKFGRDSAVFRTTDGGASWSAVYAGSVSGRPLVTQPDGRIYWLLEKGGGLITSGDGGSTWEEMLTWGPVGGPVGSLLELPDGRFATIGPSNVIISDDQGRHWRAIGPTLPYEPFGLTYSPHHEAFYIWRFYCDKTVERNPVIAESIMRLEVDLARL
jgi:photosystem II stability/assembly factor-like uncharacterized protein